MYVEIGNWKIEKAARQDDEKYINVRIIANTLLLDKENQEMLPEAFDDETINSFLKAGIIDWHHQSVLGKTMEDRAKAILGKPYDFQWEDGLPVVYARLTKSHPIVRDSIIPHLDAELPVLGGSVGGSIQKIKRVFDGAIQKAKEQIMKIDWNHLAIAASAYVVSPGSAVSLVKAYNNELMVRFSDIGAFRYDVVANHEEIMKALEFTNITDIAKYQGVDALRTQSLEGDPFYDKTREAVIFGITEGSIKPSRKGVVEFLEGRGMREAQIRSFMDVFTKNIRQMINNL